MAENEKKTGQPKGKKRAGRDGLKTDGAQAFDPQANMSPKNNLRLTKASNAAADV